MIDEAQLSPEFLKNISESLAGRVGIIEIGPLLLSEQEEKEISPLYQLIAKGSFLWRSWPAWGKVDKNIKFTKNPKGLFRNTGLICEYLKIRTKEDLLGHPNLGLIFESAITENFIRNFKSLQISFEHFHLRTRNLAEIDLILEGEMGLVPIEIKFSSYIKNEQLKTMKKFIDENNCQMGFVVNNSEKILKLSDKIIQIPVGSL